MNKICKNCGKEIDSNSEHCPNCGKYQFRVPTWAIVLIAIKCTIVLFVLFILTIACASSTGDNDTSSNKSNTENKKQVESNKSNTEDKKKTQEVVYNVGDTISTKKFDLTITSVHEATEVGTKYFSEKAKEGAKFIIVDMKYTNKTDKVITYLNLPGISLYDTTTNVKYDKNGTATSYYQIYNDIDEIGYDDLAPGLTVYDSKVYEISSDLYQNHSWQLKISNIADNIVIVNVK